MSRVPAGAVCACDPEIRCAECGGCECRPSTCPGACVPELAWTPRVVPGPVSVLIHPPAQLPRHCAGCGWEVVSDRAWREHPEVRQGRRRYHGRGLCRGCRNEQRGRAA